MHDVMISYSSKDKTIADAVCNHLESSGVRVWIAPRDIQAGESYPTAIVKGIQDCSIIVLLFTANSNKSVWVPREIERGVNYGKIIIPFKVEEARPIHSDIELCTCTQHWLDAITPPLEENIARLVEIINKLLGKATESDMTSVVQSYSKLSPLGQFYQLAERWVQNNRAYFVLESLSEEQKSILRNSPKAIEIEDEDVQLFMLEASLHYGGDWSYWAQRIENKETVARHLVNILNITYIRPRYRALYLMQKIDRTILEPLLEAYNIKDNPGLMQMLENYVFSGEFYDYLVKVSENADPEVASRARTVVFEINRYEKGMDVFPKV